jgi:hypothetical protein
VENHRYNTTKIAGSKSSPPLIFVLRQCVVNSKIRDEPLVARNVVTTIEGEVVLNNKLYLANVEK